MKKLCIKCKIAPSMTGRRYCHKCYLKRKSDFYFQNGGNKNKNRYGFGFCILCKTKIKLNRKTQKYCLLCSKTVSKISNYSNNNYIKTFGSSRNSHRDLAIKILGYKLLFNEIVHHCDGDIYNNNPKNLIIISRKQHGKLHQFIKEQRALIEKSIGEQNENCWKILITQMTTTWLKTANVKVKKLFEIGQSAA
jgi:hypothetical protein